MENRLGFPLEREGTSNLAYQFQNHEQDVIDDERPFSSVSIGRYPKENTADRPEHEHQRDAPGDVGNRLVEGHGEIAGSKRDSEEIESIPGLSDQSAIGTVAARLQCRQGCHSSPAKHSETYPGEESNAEKGPVVSIQHPDELEGVRELVHRRLQAGEARS